MIEKNLEQDCLTFHTYKAAARAQYLLLEEGYVTMLSKEEELWCLNWVWTETSADRNEVIFVNLSTYEWDWDRFVDRHPEIDWSKEE